MGYDVPDVYYQPEKFGLRIVGELNDPEACYSFDDFVLWKHEETGKFYWAVDSGCSCPTPFEHFTSIDKLTPVDSLMELMEIGVSETTWRPEDWTELFVKARTAGLR